MQTQDRETLAAPPVETRGSAESEPIEAGQAQRAQHLLITVLGDYWWRRAEPLPSAGLVRALAEFGVTSDGARSALSRLAQRGLLARSQQGRHTFYRLTEKAMRVLLEGYDTIFSFGAREQLWDGSWSVVAFSLPESERTMRQTLRTRLRRLSFGPLYDAVWISPHPRLDTVARLLRECGVETATLFNARMLSGFPREADLLQAWDLAGLRRRYERYIEDVRPLAARVCAGAVGPSEAMVARTRVMDTWRAFPDDDPDLPAQLLPPDWPRAQARALCMEVYDSLKEIASRRFAELVFH